MRISSVARATGETSVKQQAKWSAILWLKHILQFPDSLCSCFRRSIIILICETRVLYQLYSWQVFYCLQFLCHMSLPLLWRRLQRVHLGSLGI
jgi:hypothetical protein